MALPLPPSPPPPELQQRAIPFLLSRLSAALSSVPPLEPNDILSLLGPLLRALVPAAAAAPSSTPSLTPSLLPLQALLNLPSSTLVPLPILLDTVLLYPLHTRALSTLLDRALSADPTLLDRIRTDLLPALVSRLCMTPPPPPEVVHTILSLLHGLAAAHEECLALFLSEADYILPGLKTVYESLFPAGAVAVGSEGVGGSETGKGRTLILAQQAVLLFAHEVVRAAGTIGENAVKGLMGNGQFRGAYDTVFVDRKLGAEEREVARVHQEELARRDPRMDTLVNLFPSIPPSLLLMALNHPTFAVSSSSLTADEQAAPLIDAILSGGQALPPDLADLRLAVQGLSESTPPDLPNGNHGPAPTAPTRNGLPHGHPSASVERRNIWSTSDLDISRLHLKNVPTPSTIGHEIPDQLRASILRLVENQAIEEEERERALDEAHGIYRGGAAGDEEGDDPAHATGHGPRQARRATHTHGADGEGSGGEDGEEDEADDEQGEKFVPVPLPRNAATSSASSVQPGGLIPPDVQSKLELAYLASPAVFGRDGLTRRSAEREKLRQSTGMDDGQLEGWRIMLERNPHKEAILGRHQYAAPRADPPNNGERGEQRRGGGGRGGRGDGGSGRGGAGGRGGSREGGGGGGGGSERGGGGRGRANKGSRGHQNAARTRGHDRKMGRMGGGV